jgi:hypothetical protein
MNTANKKYMAFNLDREVIKQMKITMANLELNNHSLVVENLLKEWVAKNTQTKD